MIVVEGLSHSFGPRPTLRDLSFRVGPGEVFGFVGPNGAGKTTTIRILATLLQPTGEGSVEICGVDALASPEAVRRQLGFVPDAVGVYERLTVEEYVEFFAAATDVGPPAKRREAVEVALDLTGMAPLRDRMCGALSRGMRQRLALARALVHDPQVLLLDEPASGLDPRARIELFELVRQLGAAGKTILLSSHILTELSAVVTHVGIIEQGRMVASGDARTVADLLGQDRVVLVRLLEPAGARLEAIRRVAGVVEVVEREPRLLAVTVQGEERAVADVVRTAVGAGLAVVGVECEWTDLERVFLVATRGGLQ
jgi:ABC-2 type transport system ATP-binding protein